LDTIALIREEYANLEEFIKSKKIKMKNELNEETSVTYAELGDDSDEDMDSSRKRRRKEEVPSYRDDQDEDEESRKWNMKCVLMDFPDY
jgi:structure-specific recognition protein 1